MDEFRLTKSELLEVLLKRKEQKRYKDLYVYYTYRNYVVKQEWPFTEHDIEILRQHLPNIDDSFWNKVKQGL